MSNKTGRLVLSIVDENGERLTGTARIELEHRQITDRHRLDDVDVSKEIAIEGLHRTPVGLYSIRVRLDDGRVAAQFFNVRPSGNTELVLVFEQTSQDVEPTQEPGGETGSTAPLRLTARDLAPVFEPGALELYAPFVRVESPKTPGTSVVRPWLQLEAYLPVEPELPQDHALLGGLPMRIAADALQFPTPANAIRAGFAPRPWSAVDWGIFNDFVRPLSNPCRGVPSKTGNVEVAVDPRTRMGKVSGDCARVYTVSDQGTGCVVNVVTEMVEAAFTVQPHPNPTPAYPSGVPNPIVSPFTKGGINHKYKRLYVPASFYTVARSVDNGGCYVAVVDVDPASATYLDTIDWIDCGWIPEEIDFTDDNEIGVIANYMQGTATIFDASSGNVLAAEIEGFDGAAGMAGGGPWARSVRCGKVPGIGSRAFLTLTNQTPQSGLAVIDLDSPGFPRTNIDLPGFCSGVALTPDRRRALVVASNALHVVKLDQASPAIERTIGLDAAPRSYYGGIEVRPSGDLAFVATGGPDPAFGQGTTLMQVRYLRDSDAVTESTAGFADQTWNVDISPLGVEQKPHLFVTSGSGKLTIVPC